MPTLESLKTCCTSILTRLSYANMNKTIRILQAVIRERAVFTQLYVSNSFNCPYFNGRGKRCVLMTIHVQISISNNVMLPKCDYATPMAEMFTAATSCAYHVDKLNSRQILFLFCNKLKRRRNLGS